LEFTVIQHPSSNNRSKCMEALSITTIENNGTPKNERAQNVRELVLLNGNTRAR